jgi:hypothetical protein
MKALFDIGYNNAAEKMRRHDLNAVATSEQAIKTCSELDKFDAFVHGFWMRPGVLIGMGIILSVLTMGLLAALLVPLLFTPLLSAYLKGVAKGSRDVLLERLNKKGLSVPKEYEYALNTPQRIKLMLDAETA